MKRTIKLVVLGLFIAACSNGTSTSSSASPTTSLLATTTITNPPLVDGGLISIDPATLIPLQGSEPILVADWFSGVVSPNGAFAAIESLAGDNQVLQVSLIELATNEVLANVDMPHGTWDRPIVDNDGMVYWLGGEQGLSLYRVQLGDTEAEILYSGFPPSLSGVSLDLLPDGRFGVFGSRFDERPEGEATVILVAADASGHEEILLESVTAGFANEPDPDSTIQVFEFAGNAPVWDHDGDRFLLVEAARDVVTQVNLSTSEVSEHSFSLPEATLSHLFAWLTPVAQAKGPVAGVTRDAILAPDGRDLFVATLISGTEVEETSWETNRLPQDVMVLDTDTWTVSVLDVSADTLDASPNGIHLLAHGAEVTEGTSAGFEVQPSPIHVIDISTSEVLLNFQTSDVSAAEIQFSADGELVYISTWSQDTATIDILDLGLLQLTGAVSFRELSLVGQAGFMAFHLE